MSLGFVSTSCGSKLIVPRSSMYLTKTTDGRERSQTGKEQIQDLSSHWSEAQGQPCSPNLVSSAKERHRPMLANKEPVDAISRVVYKLQAERLRRQETVS
ncbi:hypothetical protein PG989_005830 [Apiospora arundinis]